MNIAIYHNLPSGGAKRSLYHIVKHLSQQGHELDLYTLNISTHTYLPLRPFVKHVISKDCWLLPWKEHGIPVLTDMRNVYHRLKSLRSINRVSRDLAVQINTGHYDLAFVTHCQFCQSPNILRYLSLPTVYYCQEPFRLFYESPVIDDERNTPGVSANSTVRDRGQWGAFHSVCRWLADEYLLKQNDLINVRYATRILANSYYSCESILRAYGRFARVNYLGVDAEQFRPLPDVKKEHLVLSIGRYHAGKQHHFIVKSLARLEERPELVIIGDTVSNADYKSFLEKLAKQLQVSLRMLDNVSDEELVVWYNRATVVAYASLLEPFGLVPLEAMACQTPVIGVREGGIRETIVDGETGFLTDRDEQAFAQAIARVLNDATLCQTVGASGRASVIKNWTWEQSVEQLLHYFSRIA